MLLPSYIELYHSGELHQRVVQLKNILSSCTLCPRDCRVDRLADQTGYCRASFYPVVARACIHRGEEPALSAASGIGNLFFAGCNLHCVFCQNWQISQQTPSRIEADSLESLSNLFLQLQKQGCGRIGLVTAVHFLPMIAEALLMVIPKGFHLPLVYNTNAYDSVETLKLMEGLIDIYLPDIKYANDDYAIIYSDAPDYTAVARKAIKEMYRQVGLYLHLIDDGSVARGLIVRHLVLPNGIAGSRQSLEWLADTFSPRITVSLMSQFYPAYRSTDFPQINRPITESEYHDTIGILNELGFEKGWLQDHCSRDYYRPDFTAEQHPFEQPLTFERTNHIRQV